LTSKKQKTQPKKAEQELEKLARIRFDGVVKSLEEAQQRINGIANAILPLSGAAAAGLVGAGKAAVDFEDALAGVAKTTDLTDAGVKAMGEEIRNLALVVPTAATDLAKITETAGQLGIKNENLVSFTRVMADLGVATDMAGESAAMTLAQFANITKMDQSNFDRLGSTITYLGNNLSTTESKIAGMAQNLASAGAQARLTEAEILGIAGAAASLGLEAQAGGTAFSKALNMINVAVATGSKDLTQYAEVAGMSAEQFAAAWKDNAAGAFISFIEGLGTATSVSFLRSSSAGSSTPLRIRCKLHVIANNFWITVSWIEFAIRCCS